MRFGKWRRVSESNCHKTTRVKQPKEVTMPIPSQAFHLLVRKIEPDDHAFFFSTYLKNKWYAKTQSTTLKKHTWMSLQHKRLEKVLKDQDVFVASFSDDPGTIIGYAFSDCGVPFCYVKLAWRDPELNVSKILLDKLGEIKK